MSVATNMSFVEESPLFSDNADSVAVNDESVSKESAKRDLLRSKLLSLPQGPFIRENRLNAWLDLMQDDPRAEWHAERLSGIGGSEIGILVAHKRGEPDAFGGTAYGLVLEKNLTFLPQKQTLAMRKGIFLENGIRQFFTEDYGCVRDEDAVNKLTFAKRLRPWMRYSPDDVVLLGNKRYLVDYKHPNAATGHGDIYLRYRSQLHMGAMISESVGVKIDGMLLVQYPEDGGDNLVVSDVPFDLEIARDIIDAGDEAWHHIVSGTNYDPPDLAEVLELPEAEMDAFHRLMSEFSSCKAVAAFAGERATLAKEEALKILEVHPVDSVAKIAAPGVSVSVADPAIDFDLLAQAIGDDAAKKPLYDTNAVLSALLDEGRDMAAFETGKFEWDEAVMVEQAEKIGLDVTGFLFNGYRVTTKTKEWFTETVAALVKDVINKIPEPEVPELKKVARQRK